MAGKPEPRGFRRKVWPSSFPSCFAVDAKTNLVSAYRFTRTDMSSMKRLLIQLLSYVYFDRFVDLVLRVRTQVKLARYARAGHPISFNSQGGYEITIEGDLDRFAIDPTSHLKSDAYIECSGGVTIGRYFHVGRHLTIYSSDHPYRSTTRIPYDESMLLKPVVIEDFVWCGANVTILPGVTVGEGAVVGASAVLTRNVEPLSIVAGNPAKVIGQRDRETFERLKAAGAYL